MKSIDAAKALLRAESSALSDLERRLGTSFERAVDLIATTKGKVIVTGVGKSALIGQKIAATLCSTGTRLPPPGPESLVTDPGWHTVAFGPTRNGGEPH